MNSGHYVQDYHNQDFKRPENPSRDVMNPGTYCTYIINQSRGILYRTVISRTIIDPKINCLYISGTK